MQKIEKEMKEKKTIDDSRAKKNKKRNGMHSYTFTLLWEFVSTKLNIYTHTHEYTSTRTETEYKQHTNTSAQARTHMHIDDYVVNRKAWKCIYGSTILNKVCQAHANTHTYAFNIVRTVPMYRFVYFVYM